MMISGLTACAAMLAAMSAQAADETRLGATVGNVLITKPIPSASLSLGNTSANKTVSGRDLRVTGANPTFTVTGQVFCKGGARLVSVQAIIGQLGLNNGQLISLAPYGESAEVLSVAGRTDADVSIPVTLPVSRQDTGAAVDLSFNPAREFNRKLTTFVGNGGSAVSYLHQDEAFDMPVKVNLVAHCRMPDSDNSVLAGRTYAGYATRIVPVTILYTGDPAIIAGPAARTTVTTQGGGGAPPAKAAPPPPRSSIPAPKFTRTP
jgi:hypothetical protein